MLELWFLLKPKGVREEKRQGNTGRDCFVLTGLTICPTFLLVYKTFSIFLDDAYLDYSNLLPKIMLNSVM